jgi:hypothetical protein
VVRDHHRLHVFAPDIDGQAVVDLDVAVEVGEADGAKVVLVGELSLETFSLGLPVGDHGAARHPAYRVAVLLYRRARPGHSPVSDRDRAGHAREMGDERVVARQYGTVGCLLPE